MTLWTLISALLLLQASGVAPADQTNLEECVTAYWKALERRDKAAALAYVYPEDLNHFLLRAEPAFSHWTLTAIELEGEEAQVSSTFQRIVAGANLRQKFKETWVKTDQGWRVRVPKPRHIADQVIETARKLKPRELPKELAVFPETVRFYAIAPHQLATISIRNGLESPARIIDFVYDQEHVEVVESSEEVLPGKVGRIRLRYKGGVEEQNQKATVRLVLEQNLERREFEIPLVYNFSNSITRWATQQKQP